MIVYNVSIKIEPNIEEEWVQWMKEKHIPDVLETGIFSGHKFLEIINQESENTYAIQYYCTSMEDLDTYFNKFAKKLQEEHSKKYINKFVSFRTIMKEID